MSDDSPRDDARLVEPERRHRVLDENLSAQKAALRRRERTLAVLRKAAEALTRLREPTSLLEMASAAATRGPA